MIFSKKNRRNAVDVLAIKMCQKKGIPYSRHNVTTYLGNQKICIIKSQLVTPPCSKTA